MAAEEFTSTWGQKTMRKMHSVSAFSLDHAALVSAGPMSWHADLPRELGGSNAAPSPVQLLLGALAASAVLLIKDTIAPQLGISVDEVAATVMSDTDDRALQGVPGASPCLQGLRLELRVSSPGGDDAVGRLIEAWMARCPVYATFLQSMGSELATA